MSTQVILARAWGGAIAHPDQQLGPQGGANAYGEEKRREEKRREWVVVAALMCLAAHGCQDDGPIAGPDRVSTRAVATWPQWVADAQSKLPAGIKAIASSVLGPDQRAIHGVTRYLKNTNRTVHRLVVYDRVSDDVKKISVDSLGQVVDYPNERALNVSKQAAKSGALSLELFARLQAMAANNQPVEVQIWHKSPPPPPRPNQSSPTLATDIKNAKSINAASIASARPPLVARIKALGGSIIYSAVNAPFVEAILPGSTILSSLAFDPNVTFIRSRPHGPKQALSTESSLDMYLGPAFHSAGYLGFGERVGIIESCGDCGIWFGNQNFAFGTTITKKPYVSCSTDAFCHTLGDGNARCISGKCYGRHATSVAGMVGIVTPPPSAGAYYATIVHANDESASHGALLDWLSQQDTHIVNESWGDGGNDLTNWLAHDYFARNSYMSITRSSGNDPSKAVNCRSFNTICVGGYDINHTTQWWWDDSIYYYVMPDSSTVGSSYLNLPDCDGGSPGGGCDRELPHLVGHGFGCTSTNNDPSDPDGLISQYAAQGGTVPLQGTSLSAPAIAGLIALIHDRYPGLRVWPEATRAVLMASAVHDVDWGGKPYSDYLSPDEKDGAGVPVAPWATNILDETPGVGQYMTYVLTPGQFDSQHKLLVAWPYLQAGKTIRVVISWDNCPNDYPEPGCVPGHGCPAQDIPGVKADFDIHVLTPGGGLAQVAASYDGAYEILEYTATSSGQHQIYIKHYQWDACYGSQMEYLGFAYFIR